MPLVALTVPVSLPVAAMRQYLARALPLWSWRCGDDDHGGADAKGSLERPQTILGRGSADMVMVTIQSRDAPLPLEAGAPPHHFHLQISQPTTDEPELAKRIAVIVCAALMIQQDEGAHCQIAPGGRWFSTADMRTGLSMCTSETRDQYRIDDFLTGCGVAGASAAAAGVAAPSALDPLTRTPAEQLALSGQFGKEFARMVAEAAGPALAASIGYAAPPDYAEEKPRADRLPTFVIALRGPLGLNWAELADHFARFDAPAGWTLASAANGGAVISGRGGTIEATFVEGPVPRYCVEDALSRSFWFQGGGAAFADMSAHLVIRCTLDTRAAPYEDVRETASLASLLIGLAARDPQAIAVFNMGVGMVLTAEDAFSATGALVRGELPVRLWTWTAPHSLVDQAVSLSTGGMLPFLGYELEVWNAPHGADFVADKLSRIIIYLLNAGPIVTNGNSFGEKPGDRSIRGFFGDSKAGRAEPTQALFLEFDAAEAATPRPDPVPAAQPRPDPVPPVRPLPASDPIAPLRPQPAAAAGFGRRVAGGFGRKGLQ